MKQYLDLLDRVLTEGIEKGDRITEAGRAYYQQKCEEWLLTQEVVEKFIIKGDSINGND